MKPVDFLVSQHVAGGIGRPRDADSADLIGDGQRVEVDPVFEQAAVEMLDLRPVGDEDIVVDARVGVTDVLRGEG